MRVIDRRAKTVLVVMLYDLAQSRIKLLGEGERGTGGGDQGAHESDLAADGTMLAF